MLVLSRRQGEQIVIGDDIVITVVDVRPDAVRLGIEAPRHVAVNRAELRQAVEKANREAADVARDPAEMARELRRVPRPPAAR